MRIDNGGTFHMSIALSLDVVTVVRDFFKSVYFLLFVEYDCTDKLDLNGKRKKYELLLADVDGLRSSMVELQVRNHDVWLPLT